MNIDINKIENGFVVTIGVKQTFCSEAMGICGLLAEWAQSEVDRLEKSSTYGDAASGISAAMTNQRLQQRIEELRAQGLLDDPGTRDHIKDALKYMSEPLVVAKPIKTNPGLFERLGAMVGKSPTE